MSDGVQYRHGASPGEDTVREDTPQFTRYRDGRVMVDSFPREMVITKELLRDCDPMLLTRPRMRSFFLNCANGKALYRLLRRGPYPSTFVARRVWCIGPL